MFLPNRVFYWCIQPLVEFLGISFKCWGLQNRVDKAEVKRPVTGDTPYKGKN